MRFALLPAAALALLVSRPGGLPPPSRPVVTPAVLEPASPAEGPRIPRSTLPGLGPGSDPRRRVDVAVPPWSALGRVQTASGGGRRGTGLWCIGALVGPRTVLTAAHCVVSAQTRQFLRAGSIGFVLGYERGTLAGHARVAGFVVASGFDPATGGPPGADWALLTLEAPPGAPALGRVLPLAPEVPGAGAPVALAGYQQDRWEVLLADLGCRVSGAERDRAGLALLRHTCAATRGSDGGPLLARAAGGEWVVVGVAVRASIGRAADTGGFAGAAGGLAVPAAAIDLSAAVPPA